MRMELIQPFINAADAVFAESLQAPTKIVDLSMDEETYRRKGVAALILIKGDIEGRVILDLAPEVALKIASHLAGGAVQGTEQVARETVCELANMVIGNSVTLLNDQGFRFIDIFSGSDFKRTLADVNFRDGAGLDTALVSGDILTIMPAVSGG